MSDTHRAAQRRRPRITRAELREIRRVRNTVLDLEINGHDLADERRRLDQRIAGNRTLQNWYGHELEKLLRNAGVKVQA